MLGNKEIAMVTKFKYLGIWIDHKLDLKRHAAEIRLTPLKDMLKELHWLPVRELLLYNILNIIHKIKRHKEVFIYQEFCKEDHKIHCIL